MILHTQWETTWIADAATGVADFSSLKKNTNHYKALFLPSALSVFNENYKSLTLCACATGPTEDDDFRREDGGMHVPNDFI